MAPPRWLSAERTQLRDETFYSEIGSVDSPDRPQADRAGSSSGSGTAVRNNANGRHEYAKSRFGSWDYVGTVLRDEPNFVAEPFILKGDLAIHVADHNASASHFRASFEHPDSPGRIVTPRPNTGASEQRVGHNRGWAKRMARMGVDSPNKAKLRTKGLMESRDWSGRLHDQSASSVRFQASRQRSIAALDSDSKERRTRYKGQPYQRECRHPRPLGRLRSLTFSAIEMGRPTGTMSRCVALGHHTVLISSHFAGTTLMLKAPFLKGTSFA
jgi:hypothetical protein